jgi:hypothetical protein
MDATLSCIAMPTMKQILVCTVRQLHRHHQARSGPTTLTRKDRVHFKVSHHLLKMLKLLPVKSFRKRNSEMHPKDPSHTLEFSSYSTSPLTLKNLAHPGLISAILGQQSHSHLNRGVRTTGYSLQLYFFLEKTPISPFL